MATVVLGLDGGSFELVKPWIEDGTLSNLARISKEGISGDMQSCLPPVTCPNWKCYATGTNPGKLGVFWWEKVDRTEQKIVNTSSATQFHGEPFWRYFEGEVGIINLPTSYPPPTVNGIHISGGPGSAQKGYTYPDSLEDELRSTYDYVVHPEKMSLLSKDNSDSPCVEEIYELIDTRFDVLSDVLESGEYSFLHLTVFYINVLQHFYWDHDVVKEAWRRIDEHLGELLESDELERIFVMSDHGSNEIHTEFHINTWLEANGYLQLSRSVTDILKTIGITRERIRPLLARGELEWWLKRVVPKRIQNLLPDEDGTVHKSGKTGIIDWEASTAVGSGQGPVYVLAEETSRRQEIKSQLISDLSGLNHDGRPVIELAIPAEQLYSGPYVEEGPDVILRQAPNVHIDGGIGSEEIFSEPEMWRGENKDTGMVIAHGDGIARGTPDDMHILDLAPTILHMLGYAIPEDFDGEVHKEFFVEGTCPATREIERRAAAAPSANGATEDVSEETTDRLEDLGYL